MVAAVGFEPTHPKRLVSEEIYRLRTKTEILFCEIKDLEASDYKYGNFTSAPYCIILIGSRNLCRGRLRAEPKKKESRS